MKFFIFVKIELCYQIQIMPFDQQYVWSITMMENESAYSRNYYISFTSGLKIQLVVLEVSILTDPRYYPV